MKLRKIAVLFFAINLLLVWPSFLPNLTDINPFDEASYIHSGHDLLELGLWPDFANSPLSGVFYALTYLPFRSSPFWLVQTCSLGRVLLFSLLWWSAYWVAEGGLGVLSRASIEGEQKKLGGGKYGLLPVVMSGMVLVSPVLMGMIRFPSDPLYAGLAGLSLWQMLVYLEKRQTKSLTWASVLMGLAALARNDGLLAFIVLLGLALLLQLPFLRSRAEQTVPRGWRGLARSAVALLLPFALLVGGYMVFYYLRTGSWEMGTLERTYLNFEAGQQVLYSGEERLDTVTESRLEAQRIFGSGEENNFSIPRAIRRNPLVYFERLKAVLKVLPEHVLSAYGIRFAVVTFLLAAGGVFDLLRQKQYALLVLLLLWPAHLASGFVITLFRTGHLQFPFYVVFVLAGIGLLALLQAVLSLPKTQPGILRAPGAGLILTWLVVLIALVVFGLLGNKLAIFYNAALVLAAMVVIWFARHHIAGHPGGQNSAVEHAWDGKGMGMALLVLFAAGLVLHGDYPSPKQRVLGVEAREQAAIFMAENLERGTLVAAAAPATVWSAHMTFANLTAMDVPSNRSPEAFVDWLRSQGIRVVYIDHVLTSNNPVLWELMNAQIGSGLERVFSADEGDVQVLIVR